MTEKKQGEQQRQEGSRKDGLMKDESHIFVLSNWEYAK
jgi:hypothetical protein